jgi:hypothetical protein
VKFPRDHQSRVYIKVTLTLVKQQYEIRILYLI